MVDIVFTDTSEGPPIGEMYFPYPAKKKLPEWFKKTPLFADAGVKDFVDGGTPYTVKKCTPLFDTLASGYIIPTYTDIQVTEEDGLPYYSWPSRGPIEFHPVGQAPLLPGGHGFPYPKWMNPWSIRTPKGYSCLFVAPLNAPNGMFTVLSGIVDTDQYTSPVNFPFQLDDPKFRGIIPAGTPMVQVIPFKRDEWRMRIGGDKERAKASEVRGLLRSKFARGYRDLFWSKKGFE